MWAGIECTVNRVGDCYGDQMQWNGHHQRPDDLERFAALGIRALRYPVLWERTAPDGLDHINWNEVDDGLHRLRELGVRPIVGLVHHGSGPPHTHLADDSFAPSLAAYAARVAERYPWIRDWTPVNEPLTTARFSGLYGHWFPHGRDERTFSRALVNQCRAIALSMRAIRKINPAARLIQTDDLGKIYSTPHLQYQADFENERRWICWDLLCGRVTPAHRMWGHLQGADIREDELRWFLNNPCPPDILGVNHYLTSDRYIDERLEHYPPESVGDNGRDRYADVEAVRALPQGTPGVRGVLQEAWERYGLPIAVTEAHLGCTREEQMRWLHDIWQDAKALRQSGVEVVAVTAWALLGSFDWNSLLTRFAGHYEPGIFDIRGGALRPTALAGLMRELASGNEPTHPVLALPGWWRRPKRRIYTLADTLTPKPPSLRPNRPRNDSARPLVILSADSVPGAAFVRLCDHRGLACLPVPAAEFHAITPATMQDILRRSRAWAVVHAAGYEDVERAEREAALCAEQNTRLPALLAEICGSHHIPLLALSTDLVFDGRQSAPYRESDCVGPQSVYGRSKAEMEQQVLQAHPNALVARSGAWFGAWDEENFLTEALRRLAAGQPVAMPNDVTLSPTYLPDLVHACLDLLIDGERGLWHLANQGTVTPFELLTRAADRAGMKSKSKRPPARITGRPFSSFGLAAPRPRYCALSSERALLLQPLEDALACYLRDCGTLRGEPGPAMEPNRRSAEAIG